MNAAIRSVAIVTGASSRIGLGLARECAREGFDLLIAAYGSMANIQAELQRSGSSVLADQHRKTPGPGTGQY